MRCWADLCKAPARWRSAGSRWEGSWSKLGKSRCETNLKKTLTGPSWVLFCFVLGFASSVREALDRLGRDIKLLIIDHQLYLPVSGTSMTRAMVVEVMRQKFTPILIRSNKGSPQKKIRD